MASTGVSKQEFYKLSNSSKGVKIVYIVDLKGHTIFCRYNNIVFFRGMGKNNKKPRVFRRYEAAYREVCRNDWNNSIVLKNII